MALYGVRPDQLQFMKGHEIPTGRGSISGRTILERRAVHIVDILSDPEYKDLDAQKTMSFRTALGVPLLRQGTLIGVMILQRRTVRAFTPKQIELATTFADQAVIAIENVRLFDEVQARTRELSEALEQQTATSEVLQVISRSPGELEPVFLAMLSNAVQVCEAKFGVLFRYSDNAFHAAATLDVPPAYAEFLGRRSFRPDVEPALAGSPLHRLLLSKDIVQSDDVSLEANPGPAGEYGGARSFIAVPLKKESELVGAFVIYRQEVRPFTNKHIDLVKNFANQAVIAIENTRLLNELRQRTDDLSEALEQQTATSEVLRVISCSPGELEPVFETMLANAIQLCGAKFGVMSLREGEAFRVIATHGAPALVEQRRREPLVRPTPGHNLERMMRTKAVVHIPDILADPESAPTLAKFGGAKALVNVPLLKDGDVIGSIVIFRQEAGPFTDKQVELVQNFAAQAVIAIENTRLLNELRESLQQQTATADVLQVISGSPGELEAVFKTMLENAVRICGANFATLQLRENDAFRVAAMHNPPPAFAAARQRNPLIYPNAHNALGRVMATKHFVHIADYTQELAYKQGDPAAVSIVELAAARTLLLVPMLKDDELIGNINIYRQEVRPFTDKQIDLLRNFAAQAVIAIENTRLLNELRESLQQQTATADVLQVISSSPEDLQPVFELHVGERNAVVSGQIGQSVSP